MLLTTTCSHIRPLLFKVISHSYTLPQHRTINITSEQTALLSLLGPNSARYLSMWLTLSICLSTIKDSKSSVLRCCVESGPTACNSLPYNGAGGSTGMLEEEFLSDLTSKQFSSYNIELVRTISKMKQNQSQLAGIAMSQWVLDKPYRASHSSGHLFLSPQSSESVLCFSIINCCPVLFEFSYTS